jgi:hypothetical protein
MLVEQGLHSNLTAMTKAEVACLAKNMEVLSEFVQGPCLENQEALVGIDGFVATLERLLQVVFEEVSPVTECEMKSSALTLLASLIEGRSDNLVHLAIADECEPLSFAQLHIRCLEIFYWDYESYDKKIREEILSRNSGSSDDDEKDISDMNVAKGKKEITKQMFNLFGGILASLNTLIVVLEQKVPSFASKFKLDDSNFENSDSNYRIRKMRDNLENGISVPWLDYRLEIGSVEVNRESRVELVSFPIPTETHFLSSDTREQFLESIDMSSSESRVKVSFLPFFFTLTCCAKYYSLGTYQIRTVIQG